ncbi:transporter [Ganoderma sinense ZZ0214-1]|uniref:Transporter n=1 Tax=Ganoderma sinense ZZ0214-1 TaxID=1077348 RepID=A0A2G8S212_9APHY|nr:transporter [Ganoderma sinense ZZ0214-1]
MLTPKLRTRKIGGVDVTAIGYGAMNLAGAYNDVLSDEERFKLLDTLYELGCTNWDTADAYADSEDPLGAWFKKTGKRGDIFLATKFGRVQSDRVVNGDPAYVHEACDKSLQRLGVDYIDLYYLYRADKTVPIEHTVGAMAELVKQGNVRHLGLSEISSDTLRRAHAVHPIAAIQVEYSPFTLDIEDEKIVLLKTARELGVAVVAYSPLGRGFLTGKYRSFDDLPEKDWRRAIPKYQGENFPNIVKLSDGLAELGKKYNATAGQIALAWLLAQGEDIIPIPGTTKIANIRENLAATDIKLSPEDVQEVRKISQVADAGKGDRYPPVWMHLLFADTPALQE